LHRTIAYAVAVLRYARRLATKNRRAASRRTRQNRVFSVNRVGSRILAYTAIAMLALCPALMSQTQAAVTQRQTAIALEQQGRSGEAEVAWRNLLKLQPGSAEAYAHLGFLESHQEHYAQAIPLYRKALGLNPEMPGLRMNFGLALFKAGQLRDALHVFQDLLEREPPSSAEAQRLTTLIGLSHYGLDEYAEAIPYLKQATANDPQNLPFRLILAHSCLWSKQYQCVLDVYHQILLLNAESAEADMLAGEAMDEMQDHAGAIEQFRSAVKANPKEPNVHFGLGYLLWTQSQYQEAAKEFQAELANVPNNAQALAFLADSKIKLNDREAALPLLKKAAAIDPELEIAHIDLGALYSDSGRNAEALRELKIAARLKPSDVNVHWRLARLYQTMGRKDEAKVEFDKTRSLTSAADASVFRQLNNGRPKASPTPANGRPHGNTQQ
jgi:tetratricopeptide (TPR) repeat protein